MAHRELEATGLQPGTFSGQTVVITGAGQGIGRASAELFAHLGARVVIAEVAASGPEAAAAIVATGGQALCIPTDVADAASVQALAEAVAGRLGSVDVLINSALLAPVAPVVEIPLDVWDRVLAVNLRGTFLTCRAFLPGMVARGLGTIVNMISTEAMPGLAAYAASTQGIAGFSQSLAAEVGERGVRVVALAPGMVDTSGLRDTAAGLAPRLGSTEQDYLGQSPHPAYTALMPACHAAIATACLVARLAAAYHGEVVNGYTVLERAGLTSSIAPPPAVTRAEYPHSAGGRAAALAQAIELADKLHDMLMATDAEFERLPVFVRPMARGGFQSKVGCRIQDTLRAAVKLGEALRRMQVSHTAADVEFEVDFQRLVEMFNHLVTYYRGLPTERTAVTRDEASLERLARQSGEREALLVSLLAAMRAIQS